MTGARDLDGRDELTALERLDEVGQRPSLDGLVDELALAKGREDHHGGAVRLGDAAGHLDTVHARHLDVEYDHLGVGGGDQFEHLVAPTGVADDRVALFLEGLPQVEADDRVVLGECDAHLLCHLSPQRSCGRATHPG